MVLHRFLCGRERRQLDCPPTFPFKKGLKHKLAFTGLAAGSSDDWRRTDPLRFVAEKHDTRSIEQKWTVNCSCGKHWVRMARAPFTPPLGRKMWQSERRFSEPMNWAAPSGWHQMEQVVNAASVLICHPSSGFPEAAHLTAGMHYTQARCLNTRCIEQQWAQPTEKRLRNEQRRANLFFHR